MSDPIFFPSSFLSSAPKVHREETAQLSQARYKLLERRCMIWIFLARIMALDITMGIVVTLFMFSCFFNNQGSYEVVMLEVF